MRWGTELWDGFDKVTKYFHDGIDFYEKYEEFLKERCSIENSYAKSLRKMIKSYELISLNYTHQKKQQPQLNTASTAKESATDESRLTYLKCFQRTLGELKDMAGQHELIAENIQKRIVDRLVLLVKTFKDERKKCIEDRDKCYQFHQSNEELLKKAKSKYDASFRELEKCKEMLARVEEDDRSSRNDIKKQQAICERQSRLCEGCKGDYAKQLGTANEIKNKYYTEQLPAILTRLETLESQRLKNFQEFIKEFASVEVEVLPRIERCIQEINLAHEQISIENDLDIVVNLYKTGYHIPNDHPFEDLSEQLNNSSSNKSFNGGNNENINANTINSQTSLTYTSNSHNRLAKYKTLTRIKGLFASKSENDSLYDLPPQQQKKELLKKIDALNVDLGIKEKEREGLEKITEIYKKNQKFGDSQSAIQALKQNEEKLNNLKAQLENYKSLLDDLEVNGILVKKTTSANTSATMTPLNNRTNKKLNTSQSELSVSGSVSKTEKSLPSTPISQHSRNKNSLNSNNDKQNIKSYESFDEDEDLQQNQANESEQNYNSNNNNYNLKAATTNGAGNNHQTIEDNYTENTQLAAQNQYDHIDSSLTKFSTSQENIDEVIIGKAIVLYTFEGQVQNSISIVESESLNVLEKDSGDGWTLVKRATNNDKGYVPTDYIKIEYF